MVSPLRFSRSPHGERGLKLVLTGTVRNVIESLPTRGAWIEIHKTEHYGLSQFVAPHTGSVD